MGPESPWSLETEMTSEAADEMRMDENRNRAWRNARLAVSLMAFVLVSATVVRAQNETNRQKPAVPPSELGRDNLSRVAASAADIKTVLVKDTGLMVELKRWVARDATSQGQIISETDLTDDAIFDRLQSDVQFRSVATQLVQRYGYLVPQLNPDSAAGKEQELLVKERVKLLAQREEEEEQDKARAKRARSTQNSPNCNVLDSRSRETTTSKLPIDAVTRILSKEFLHRPLDRAEQIPRLQREMINSFALSTTCRSKDPSQVTRIFPNFHWEVEVATPL
jgi:hypothetical protein